MWSQYYVSRACHGNKTNIRRKGMPRKMTKQEVTKFLEQVWAIVHTPTDALCRAVQVVLKEEIKPKYRLGAPGSISMLHSQATAYRHICTVCNQPVEQKGFAVHPECGEESEKEQFRNG
jgi:hypothetical protein